VPRNTLFYLPIGKHKLESTTRGPLFSTHMISVLCSLFLSFSVLNSHDLFSLPLSRSRPHQFVSIVLTRSLPLFHCSGSFCSIPMFFLYLFLCLLFDGFSVLFFSSVLFLSLLYGFSALFSFLCFLLFYDFFLFVPLSFFFFLML
jgi:hypothetical protein